MIPYARHVVRRADIRSVAQVLREGSLTQGERVPALERSLRAATGGRDVVVFSNGTFALLAAYHAAGWGRGDEVIIPAVTFVATANALLALGARPVLCDIDPETGLLDPADVARRITQRTRGIVSVDFAGQPCDYPRLRRLARTHGLRLVADACHALGASREGKHIADWTDLAVFSFHPAKGVTTGEGGAVATRSPALAKRLRRFRDHGLVRKSNPLGWGYRQVEWGLNGRMTDFQAALGSSQIARLRWFLSERRRIALRYDEAFRESSRIRPLRCEPSVRSAHHLYVVRVPHRRKVFAALRRAGIGVQVHYLPLHHHPVHRSSARGPLAGAEEYYRGCISLPCWAGLPRADQEKTIRVLRGAVRRLSPES